MNKTELEIEADLDIGNRAKLLAIATLGLGSLLAGLLPRAISFENRRKFPFLISLMLCFGAGVLLATSLVHMLPDVRKEMPQNAELYICVGFFIIYFIDEFVHFFFGEAFQHSHIPSGDRNRNDSTTQQSTIYGSTTNSETESLINNDNNITHPDHTAHHINNHNHNHNELNNCDSANARICHTGHQEPCSETMTGTFGLLIALSLHSLIEGLAIGVQDNKTGVLLLLAAVACHKYVMGFCLGLEICSNSTTKLKSHVISVMVFSLGSVVGIGIGMALIQLPNSLKKNILPILQALAGGTLLYVTVCEIMPREKTRWHQNRRKKFAGIVQFFAIGLGFSLMVIINYYLDENEQ